ncbi:HNH endonuclease [Leucobacter sp. W1153]|uniref:HNH endonuclease n=1 Tax=Leucobacter sp. W1153 TaxID=3439064 RepID=UPI003F2CFAFA
MSRRPDLTTTAWKKLRLHVLDRDGWQCTYCGKGIEGFDATVDHIMPFVSEEESNHMHNLISACRSCNSTRQDRILTRMPWFNKRWITGL